MSRKKTHPQLAWRDEDPAWQAERENDRIVFRKIRREQLKNRKTAKIIRGLFLSPLWVPRMSGKSAETWRRKYNVWRKKVGRCASGKIAV